jgi:hypothetical protein
MNEIVITASFSWYTITAKMYSILLGFNSPVLVVGPCYNKVELYNDFDLKGWHLHLSWHTKNLTLHFFRTGGLTPIGTANTYTNR